MREVRVSSDGSRRHCVDLSKRGRAAPCVYGIKA
jgi:hypothetical protein